MDPRLTVVSNACRQVARRGGESLLRTYKQRVADGLLCLRVFGDRVYIYTNAVALFVMIPLNERW